MCKKAWRLRLVLARQYFSSPPLYWLPARQSSLRLRMREKERERGERRFKKTERESGERENAVCFIDLGKLNLLII